MVGIRSVADYSPFGVELDGRTASNSGYRYSFQGQEKDDEIKGEGNSINYKYRMHDPRVGRFFAVDPLAPKYPWNSVYAFSENRVIDALEIEGLEQVEYTYVWNEKTKSYPKNPTVINLGYGNGEVIVHRGGPMIPEGWDERRTYYNDKNEIIADRLTKDAGRIISEYGFVMKMINSTKMEVTAKLKTRMFQGEARISEEFNKSTLEINEQGAKLKIDDPDAEFEVGGGIMGVNLTYGESSSGEVKKKIKAGNFEFESNSGDPEGDSQGVYYKLELKPLSSLNIGVENRTVIKIGFERKGATSVNYKDYINENGL